MFEYYDSPIFPPPLNFVSYLISACSYFKRKSKIQKYPLTSDDEDDEQQENHAKGKSGKL